MLAFLKKLFTSRPEYRFDFAAAKRSARIILIDDDKSALPMDDLTRDNYAIRQEVLVTPELLSECETGKFDIILLDYNGIAPASLTKDDGFGVFDRIRAANPDQYIVSISAQTYDISRTAYFKEANGWLRKPTDLAETKNVIDCGIRYIFDKSQVFDRLKRQALAEGVSPKDVEKLINEFTKNDITDLNEALTLVKKLCRISQVSSGIISVTRSIIRLSTS